jgi:chemotaxis signal transduction protein
LSVNDEALVVIIAGRRCAVPMRSVREVRLFDHVTWVPGAPSWTRGLVDRDGTATQLIDPARRIGVVAGLDDASAARPCVVFVELEWRCDGGAMLVDGVDRIIALRPVDGKTDLPERFVSAVIDDEPPLALLDLDMLFALEER